MVLIALAAPALAGSYTGTTVAIGAMGRNIYYAQMSPNGNTCFSTYGREGGTVYWWQPGDSAPTPVVSGASSIYCADVTNSEYAVAYGYDESYAVMGWSYDALTGELTELESVGASSYPYMLNENGYAAGWSYSTEGPYSPVWWAPGEASANVVADHAGDYASPIGLTATNEMLIGAYAYNGSLWDYTYSMYDLETDVTIDFEDVYADASQAILMEDGNVAEYAYYSGDGVTVFDPVYDTMTQLEATGTTYLYVSGSNVAGELLVTRQDSSGSYTAGCWSAARGLVDLDSGGATYTYAYAINDVGMVVGYALDYASGTYETRPMVWDCATGAGEVIDAGLGDVAYAMNITESGEVLLYGYESSGRGYYLHDLRSGSTTRIGGGRGYPTLYGFSQETGAALLLESGRSGVRLRYYAYTP